MENKRINFTKMEYKLVSVNYNVDRLDETKIEIDVYDELKFEKIVNNKLTSLFTRILTFDNEKKFGVQLVFRITSFLDDETTKHFNNDNDKAIKFIDKNKEDIANDTKAGSKGSLIIGQLTSGLSFGPIVLPPYFINKRNSNK